MKVWVTRNKRNVASPILVSKGNEPTWEKGFWSLDFASDLTEMHTPSSFKDQYGFTPKKGSCRQMELTLTEIRK
jgi:hypothetical protein